MRSLAARADIVVENFRPGALEKWGLGYESLSEDNPGLVLVRLSGYGQTGPYRDRPGFGAIAESMGGMRYVTGFPDRPPVRLNLSIGDSLAALHAVIGALMALHHRRETGAGQVVDVALYEAVFNMMESTLPEFDRYGIVRERTGTNLTGIVPSNTYPTADGGHIVIGGNGDSIFKRLMRAIGRDDLADDPALANNAGRASRAAELDAAIAAWTSTQTLDDALDVMAGAQVPSGKIFSAADMVADPQYAARGMIERATLADGTSVAIPAVVPEALAHARAHALAGSATGRAHRRGARRTRILVHADRGIAPKSGNLENFDKEQAKPCSPRANDDNRGWRSHEETAMRRNFVCTIIAAAVFAVAPGLASGQSVEKQKVTIAVGGKAAFYYLPLAIAEQLGYFKDEGLNVEVIDFAGGSKALQAVVGGSADVVSGAYEHTINLQSRKQYFTAFVMQGRAPQIVLGVSTKSEHQVRGRPERQEDRRFGPGFVDQHGRELRAGETRAQGHRRGLRGCRDRVGGDRRDALRADRRVVERRPDHDDARTFWRHQGADRHAHARRRRTSCSAARCLPVASTRPRTSSRTIPGPCRRWPTRWCGR